MIVLADFYMTPEYIGISLERVDIEFKSVTLCERVFFIELSETDDVSCSSQLKELCAVFNRFLTRRDRLLWLNDTRFAQFRGIAAKYLNKEIYARSKVLTDEYTSTDKIPPRLKSIKEELKSKVNNSRELYKQMSRGEHLEKRGNAE